MPPDPGHGAESKGLFDILTPTPPGIPDGHSRKVAFVVVFSVAYTGA
jgi:hypothetical protein